MPLNTLTIPLRTRVRVKDISLSIRKANRKREEKTIQGRVLHCAMAAAGEGWRSGRPGRCDERWREQVQHVLILASNKRHLRDPPHARHAPPSPVNLPDSKMPSGVRGVLGRPRESRENLVTENGKELQVRVQPVFPSRRASFNTMKQIKWKTYTHVHV